MIGHPRGAAGTSLRCLGAMRSVSLSIKCKNIDVEKHARSGNVGRHRMAEEEICLEKLALNAIQKKELDFIS